jgi:hypothetical protein
LEREYGRTHPSYILSHSHPRVAGNKERAGENVLSVRESLKDTYFDLRSKREKMDYFA